MLGGGYLGVVPEEVWFEILSWLPVKDLMRLRCVSKWWNSAPSHPTLVKLHLQKSIKNSYILLLCLHRWIAPYSVHSLLDNPISTINGSHSSNYDYVMSICNGLVLLTGFSVGNNDLGEYLFKFWNPATRNETQYLAPIYLDFSFSSAFAFGFGYDDWTGTYKLLAIILDLKSEIMEVRVYCLGDTSWKTILTCPASFLVADASSEGRFVSGTVNFLALSKLSYDWKSASMDEMVIVSYDLRKDTYRYLSMPYGLVEKSVRDPTLETLKGCLCLNHWGTTHFSVWLMREFGVDKSWNQLLRVSYENLSFHDYLVVRPMPVILCMDESEDVMLLADLSKDTGEIIRYKKRDNAIEVFTYDHKISLFAFEYVQSLVWPFQN